MRTINYAGYRMLRGFRSVIYKSNGEIHYISGTDVLPVPLEGEQEKKAIEMLALEKERERGRNILIEHNLRLVVYIARKFDNTGAGMEDLISIGTIGLIKAINSYNPEKNIKLATYASRCIENEILMYLRRSSKLKMEVSIDEPLNVDWDGNELLLSDILGTDENVIYSKMEEEVNYHLLYKALSRLSPREKTNYSAPFWDTNFGRTGKNSKRGGRSPWYFSILHFQAGEEDHRTIKKGYCENGRGVNVRLKGWENFASEML